MQSRDGNSSIWEVGHPGYVAYFVEGSAYGLGSSFCYIALEWLHIFFSRQTDSTTPTIQIVIMVLVYCLSIN